MAPLIPGELIPEPGELELNAGRPVTTISVANGGDRPIQVGSHFHFAEANGALQFDRDAARGQSRHHGWQIQSQVSSAFQFTDY